jgi:hypothetical protein
MLGADWHDATLAAGQMQGVVPKFHDEIAAPDHDCLGVMVVTVPASFTAALHFTRRTFTAPSRTVSSLRSSRAKRLKISAKSIA